MKIWFSGSSPIIVPLVRKCKSSGAKIHSVLPYRHRVKTKLGKAPFRQLPRIRYQPVVLVRIVEIVIATVVSHQHKTVLTAYPGEKLALSSRQVGPGLLAFIFMVAQTSTGRPRSISPIN